jgi:hypothetical protein
MIAWPEKSEGRWMGGGAIQATFAGTHNANVAGTR